MFSWAEFMAEEPVKLKRRSRKPQPSTPPLFDWALTHQRHQGLQAISECASHLGALHFSLVLSNIRVLAITRVGFPRI